MTPARAYRLTLAKGMIGHDVWALQLNLHRFGHDVKLDGHFGYRDSKGVLRLGATGKAVVATQKTLRIVQDGIAGPTTQRKMASKLIAQAEANFRLPKKVLAGICEGESGWAVGATNFSKGGGADLGWMQDRVGFNEWTEQNFVNAFDGGICFPHFAHALRERKDEYTRIAPHDPQPTQEQIWRYVVLSHNWPAAAVHFANGTISRWTYLATWYPNRGADEGTYVRGHSDGSQTRSYGMNDVAQWITSIGLHGVSTGHQWATTYVNSKLGGVGVGTVWPR